MLNVGTLILVFSITLEILKLDESNLGAKQSSNGAKYLIEQAELEA